MVTRQKADKLKHIRIIVLGAAALVPMAAGAASAGAIPVESIAPDVEEPAEPVRPGPAFSAEQLHRLGELRAWLARRRLERERNPLIVPTPTRARSMTVYTDRQLLTPLGQRYAVGFQNRRDEAAPSQGNPVLHIGRGPDGRIHHSYIFTDAERDGEPPPTAYSYGATSKSGNPRQALPKGSGTIQAGQRIVRIWTPEPADQRAAPRLEYELPDQRRQ